MNPQAQPDEKAGHQAAADLAFTTSLSQMLQGSHPLQQGQTPNAPQEPQNAPEQEENPNTPDTPGEEKGEDMGKKLTELELSLTEKFDQFRKEIKTDSQREMDTLKQTIKDALKD